MEPLLDAIQGFAHNTISYASLGNFVYQFDYAKLDYKPHIPTDCAPGDYGRNILTLEPFECVLIYWPPGIESAIHFHKGFYGYVVVLEGALDNILYRHEAGVLAEYRAMRFLAGSIADEPVNVIHKLANPSKDQCSVTLHFYYPALDTLEDLIIYNTVLEAEGVLSKEAAAASWSSKEGHFKEVREKTFRYEPMEKHYAGKSHVIHPVVPKPEQQIISKMIAAYYCEQAESYDELDSNVAQRNNYTARINQFIAEDIAQMESVEDVLHIACGTGSRAKSVRSESGREYHITGVDMSVEMCKLAAEKNIDIIQGSWLEVELPENKQFDAIAWLYAFGHICSREVRVKAVQKIYKHLKPGAAFYLDVFHLHNKNEWGPNALAAFKQYGLEKSGYEPGDVFYRRIKGSEIAFLHYFTEEEIQNLLKDAGFEFEDWKIIGYAVDSGKIKESAEEGFFYIKAVKKTG